MEAMPARRAEGRQSGQKGYAEQAAKNGQDGKCAHKSQRQGRVKRQKAPKRAKGERRGQDGGNGQAGLSKRERGQTNGRQEHREATRIAGQETAKGQWGQRR